MRWCSRGNLRTPAEAGNDPRACQDIQIAASMLCRTCGSRQKPSGMVCSSVPGRISALEVFRLAEIQAEPPGSGLASLLPGVQTDIRQQRKRFLQVWTLPEGCLPGVPSVGLYRELFQTSGVGPLRWGRGGERISGFLRLSLEDSDHTAHAASQMARISAGIGSSS